jgi:hypothetical protein
MSQDFQGAQQGAMKPEVQQAVTQLGLDYRLMTQFTSFVAVEEMVVTDGGQPRRIDVPVEVPEGVNRATVFGDEARPSGTLTAGYGRGVQFSTLRAPSQIVTTRSGSNSAKSKRVAGGGGGSGQGAGIAGVASSSPPSPPSPASPPKSYSALIATDGPGDADLLRTLTPEERKRLELQSKFHPMVLAVIDRLRNPKATAGADEVKFIRKGKAEIQIWLTDKSPETLAKLKELGFEVVLDPKTAKLVIGRMPIEKLAALAELKSVRYVGPQM